MIGSNALKSFRLAANSSADAGLRLGGVIYTHPSFRLSSIKITSHADYSILLGLIHCEAGEGMVPPRVLKAPALFHEVSVVSILEPAGETAYSKRT